MKIAIDKIPGFNKLPPFLRNNPKLALAVIFCFTVILAFLLFAGSKETQKIRKSLDLTEVRKTTGDDKDVGVLVGSVDTKSYVSRIEKQYYDISAKFDSVNERMGALEKNTQDLRKNQSEISRIVIDLDKRAAGTLTKDTGSIKRSLERGQSVGFLEDSLAPLSLSQPARQAMNLEMAKVGEIKIEEKTPGKRYVYLPLGSFVKCTLLTGVYAPANENNPLPVLVSVDEAFYGPNNTRIPLKGAFAIGKAVGDVVSKRAIIQIVSFSTVLPTGQVFEHEANLGYLADNDGHLGIPGQLIYNTGRQLSLDFLSGFLAGGAEALSQAETSTVTGAYGQTSRNVTGNTSRYAMFSGLANSAQGMSSYYQNQLEAMIPAVKIEAGKSAVFVVQKGVQIEGLEIAGDNFGFIDY
ncbi:MAG: TraB/VirB10 family protein [Candidatus Portnoybacteria bacterium]|nr:TraB/VirB10 family protein [Candidatus Portnoybacteria bacterium]